MQGSDEDVQTDTHQLGGGEEDVFVFPGQVFLQVHAPVLLVLEAGHRTVISITCGLVTF